jgi:hypothetical protein
MLKEVNYGGFQLVYSIFINRDSIFINRAVVACINNVPNAAAS